MPVDIVEAEEGPAYGAALSGRRRRGSSEFGRSGLRHPVRVASTVRPNPESATVMNKQYTAYRRAVPRAREIFAGLRNARVR